MSELQFEWDESKSRLNLRKHGVLFEEAQSTFYDENALLIDDPDHSESEHRFILLGISSAARTLVVSHCYRESGGTIRIISARKATRPERDQYSSRLR